ncbi:hypothetical protein MVEN_02282600 [Mycena venus]|uniref:Uncharacterized protein n=1 Tax=Mycena venus TaxID=2733690 RepID=A0A8H7CGE8_9AGAR|nr:hypothetical protein MVEN_02282600 [Mycena venus]
MSLDPASLASAISFSGGWLLCVHRRPIYLSRPLTVSKAPAQQAVVYKTVKFHRGLEDDIPIYERPPSAEVDQAWEELYQYAASRIPKPEAVQMTNTTWPILHEEGNYVMALDVFHQLHCLVRPVLHPLSRINSCNQDILRQNLHPGHNYTLRSPVHLRHCVGAIRQALMCYADLSPVVWQWSARYKEAEQRDDILHTCRDFDRIQSWAKERSMGTLPDLSVYIEG